MDILENAIAKTTPERGNELKALLFNFLLKEYAYQYKYLITLLELFLVHFYKINDDMKDFVQLLIHEATEYLEGKLLEQLVRFNGRKFETLSQKRNTSKIFQKFIEFY